MTWAGAVGIDGVNRNGADKTEKSVVPPEVFAATANWYVVPKTRFGTE
jgi:hypothetical protein